MSRVLAVDAGTTGVTALVIDETGTIVGRGYREFEQHFPRPGWVEHDAGRHLDARGRPRAREALRGGGSRRTRHRGHRHHQPARDDRRVGPHRRCAPPHHAIVWQDRRTARRCDELRAAGHATTIRQRTGLVVDAYFSATKLEWLLRRGARGRRTGSCRAAGVRHRRQLGDRQAHRRRACTPPTRRTRHGRCSTTSRRPRGARSCASCSTSPTSVLPEVRPNTGDFGVTDARGLLRRAGADPRRGRRPAGGAVRPGLLARRHVEEHLRHRQLRAAQHRRHGHRLATPLLTSVGWDLGDGPVYVLEGSIFVTGAAVQWLRDGLQIIDRSRQTRDRWPSTVADTGDVYFVPAFTGLGAPHWDPYARGTIIGLTRGTDPGAHRPRRRRGDGLPDPRRRRGDGRRLRCVKAPSCASTAGRRP